MQNENIDSFIEFLYSIEEAETILTADQVQKLTLIQTKVSELVTKVNQNISTQPIAQPQMQPQPLVMAAVSEKRVRGFDEFINEKIEKHGNKWLVKDSKGKKTLGTHPTKEKAIDQLQAIEISKKKAGK
jgi:hypothetical protein